MATASGAILSGLRRALGVIILVCLCVGCATWETEEPAAKPFGAVRRRLSPESVVLESQAIAIPMSDEQWLERLWMELDEQHFSSDLRRRLAANGLRVGIVSLQLPDMLREAIDEQKASAEQVGLNEDAGASGQSMYGYRSWQAIARHRNELVTSPTRDTMVILLSDEERVVGQTFNQAQCKLSLRVFPLGDGGARMELVPEVHHGPPTQRIVGDSGVFRFDSGPQRNIFETLTIDASLSLGQTLAITCTNPPKGLGQQFFCETGSPNGQKRLLLIRLAQSQYDNLFLDDESDAPLASSEAM
jgi:hypothetical protein